MLKREQRWRSLRKFKWRIGKWLAFQQTNGWIPLEELVYTPSLVVQQSFLALACWSFLVVWLILKEVRRSPWWWHGTWQDSTGCYATKRSFWFRLNQKGTYCCSCNNESILADWTSQMVLRGREHHVIWR